MIIRRRRQKAIRAIEMHDKSLDKSSLKIDTYDCYLLKFNKNLKFIGEPVCTIDITGFKRGDLILITPCHHIFHSNCIFEWINANPGGKRCPMCNFNLGNTKFQFN